LRYFAQLEDTKRTGNLIEQPWHIAELSAVPIGLDEGHERLPRLREVRDRLLDHGVQQVLGLRAWQRAVTTGTGVYRCLAKARNLIVKRSFHVQQRASDIEQCCFVSRPVAADHFGDRLALLLHDAPRHPQPEHAQRVGNTIKHIRLRVQRRNRVAGRAHVQVEHVLDPQQIFLDRATNGIQQGAVVARHAAFGMGDLRLGRQVRLQPENVAHFANAAVIGRRVRNEIKQLPREFQRRIFRKRRIAGIGKSLDLPFDAGQRALERLRRLESPGLQRLQRPTSDPEQSTRMLRSRHRHQSIANLGQCSNQFRIALVAKPTQQRRLETRPQCLGLGTQLILRQLDRGTRHCCGQRPRKIRREQHRLGQTTLAARGTQLVEQRQQHHRDVLQPRLQALKVIGQLHDAAHQHGKRLVALGNRTLQQRQRQLLHFFCDHRGAIELHHAQGTVHLMQVRGTRAHLAGVGGVLDEGLDRESRLAQGFIQLGLDPVERGEVDVFLQPHARVSPLIGRCGACCDATKGRHASL